MDITGESGCFLLDPCIWQVGDNAAETQASSSPREGAEGCTRAGGPGKLYGLAVPPASCHLPPVLLLSWAMRAETAFAPLSCPLLGEGCGQEETSGLEKRQPHDPKEPSTLKCGSVGN